LLWFNLVSDWFYTVCFDCWATRSNSLSLRSWFYWVKSASISTRKIHFSLNLDNKWKSVTSCCWYFRIKDVGPSLHHQMVQLIVHSNNLFLFVLWKEKKHIWMRICETTTILSFIDKKLIDFLTDQNTTNNNEINNETLLTGKLKTQNSNLWRLMKCWIFLYFVFWIEKLWLNCVCLMNCVNWNIWFFWFEECWFQLLECWLLEESFC
jgi:hypothetical protein